MKNFISIIVIGIIITSVSSMVFNWLEKRDSQFPDYCHDFFGQHYVCDYDKLF